jgi:hypothetical protein
VKSYLAIAGRQPDVVIGFHFQTPHEQVIVLETRAKDPNLGNAMVTEFLMALPPFVHAIGDSECRFENPPLYGLLDELVFSIVVPVALSDLLRLEGLYSRRRSMYQFCGVLNKLNNLLACGSLSEAVTGELFPTVDEIRRIADKAPAFYALPIDIGMPPAIVRFERGHMNLGITRAAEGGWTEGDPVAIPDALREREEGADEGATLVSRARLTTFSLRGIGPTTERWVIGPIVEPRPRRRNADSMRHGRIVQRLPGLSTPRRTVRSLSCRI